MAQDCVDHTAALRGERIPRRCGGEMTPRGGLVENDQFVEVTADRFAPSAEKRIKPKLVIHDDRQTTFVGGACK
jgi:hypothetical protein